MLTCMSTLMLWACKEEDYYTKRVQIMNVSGPNGSEILEYVADGKSQVLTYTVIATTDWKVSLSSSDFSLNPTSGGVGKTAVSVMLPINETGLSRSSNLTFTCSDGTTKEFVISQKAQKPYLEIDVHDVTITGDGETFVVNVDTNQPEWSYEFGDDVGWVVEQNRTGAQVTFSVLENTSGAKRSVDIRFYATDAPELMDYVSVVQNIPVAAPVADLLDVVFNEDGTAYDGSAMKMDVKYDRRDNDMSVAYSEKYDRYVAKFNNATIARSSLAAGYYYIPYTTTSDFATKLADGFSYELVFCSYTDPTAKQVKPFASTQAGGTGMCFRASTGEINFEVHVGGSWCELYSGVLPQKSQYYHVVATWDKANGMALLYVDGQLTASKNTSGDFKFMDTSVDARWFGIGADPNAKDQGEASFYGEVVIARLYDKPMSSDEVKALYKLVK